MRLRAERSCAFGVGGGALWPRHERGLSLIRRQAGHRASAMGNLPSETKAGSPSRTSASHERLLCVCDGPTEAYGIRVNNIGTIRGICSFPSLFFPFFFLLDASSTYASHLQSVSPKDKVHFLFLMCLSQLVESLPCVVFCFWGFLNVYYCIYLKAVLLLVLWLLPGWWPTEEGPLCSHTTQTFLSVSPFNSPRTTSHFLSTICFCFVFLHVFNLFAYFNSFIIYIAHITCIFYSLFLFTHLFIHCTTCCQYFALYVSPCSTRYLICNYICEDVPRVPDHMLIRTSKDL